MFDFEDESKIREERLEKKYQELYKKQMKLVRRILLFTFLPMGIMFCIIGLVDIDHFLPLLIMGVVFLVVGCIISLCFSRKGNYEKYKKNVEKYAGISSYTIMIQVGLLEERVKWLEQENQELKDQIKEKNR